ncbi:unnamed protein product, partial [Allacma fusca]
WFSMLTQDGKECAMMLTSMGQVAAARVPAFLTKFDVPVYKLTESNEAGGKSVYVRTTMKAGSVLRLLGVWADLNGASKNYGSYSNHQSVSKGAQFLGGSLGGFGGRLVARSLSNTPQQPPQVQYVQCLSHENEPIFIPFWATGIFYPIAPRGGRNPQHIYPLSAIARTQKLPVRAKMVYGSIPNNIPDFSGTLQIESVDTDEVILACTLLKERPSLFELEMDSDLMISAMTSEDLFTKSTGYQTALNFCHSEADNWKRQIRSCRSKLAGGTVSSTSLLKKNKTLRIRSSPPPPSKLSLLFRPTSAPFGNLKDPLRRSKSFNVEIQSVSLSLTQDEEEEETKKLSTLFNFMNKGQHGKTRNNKEKQLQRVDSIPDILPHSNKHAQPTNVSHHSSHPHHHRNSHDSNNLDLPYGRVLDEVTEEENIYSEITDALTMKLHVNPIHSLGMNFHRLPIPRHQSASNMSSLLKGGGGSDGAFSGTLSGTFSSSNPSTREEDIYDSVF